MGGLGANLASMSRNTSLSTETRMSEEFSTQGRDPRVPGLTVLHHPDSGRVGERAALLGLAARGGVPLSRREPDFSAPGGATRRPLAHSNLSRSPIVLSRGTHDGAVHLDTRGSRTRVEVEGVPVEDGRTCTAEDLERGVVLRLGSHIVLLLHRLDPLDPMDLPSYGLVGESASMVRVRREIQKVSDLQVSVLLRGETGSGKELVARAIHDASSRRDGPFVAVNMAALPPSLAAAELFGAVRGAYTGADRRRRGLFAQAEGGTLFLDEVGETPPEVQALLLRALETREIRPVGGEESRRVDVRLVSATDADLEAGIATERFRAPLLHRLAGFEIRLPPLRERRDDFGRLLHHFLRRELAAIGEEQRLRVSNDGPWLPARLVARLAAYDWPGNVRQLLNVTRQIVIASRGEVRASLPEAVETLLAMASATAVTPPAPATESPSIDKRRKPSDLDDDELVELLRAHRFNLRAAAAAIGISPTSLYALIEQCPRLRKPSQLGRDEIEASLARHGDDIDAAALELEVSSLGLKRRLKELGLR